MKQVLVYLMLGLLFSCSSGTDNKKAEQKADVEFTVQSAPEWTDMFNRTKGWFGGDGIFAIPFSGRDSFSDDSVLFLFSDTMFGEIINGKLQPGYSMVNNSVMILKGREPQKEQSHFLVKQSSKGEPETLFVPKTAATKEGDYYWLGDGFVNPVNKNLYIFAYRIRNTDDGSDFPFKEVGNSLLIIPHGEPFPFANYRQIDLPFSQETDSVQISFGAAVHSETNDEGNFVYVYGIRGKSKELIAARVKADAIENSSDWKYWDGKNWGSDLNNATTLEDSVSNELSVTPIGDNQYALVYQYAGIFPTIYLQVGPTPVGPFGPRKKVWDTTTDIKDPDLFTYNAKAHPAISRPGELLVSYNVNSFKFFDVIERIPDLYRPRFIRITFHQENN